MFTIFGIAFEGLISRHIYQVSVKIFLFLGRKTYFICGRVQPSSTGENKLEDPVLQKNPSQMVLQLQSDEIAKVARKLQQVRQPLLSLSLF